MNTISNKAAVILVLIAVATTKSFSQGFFNFNFEAAQIPNGTQPGTYIATTNAMPHWIAYFGNPIFGTQQNSSVAYNTRDLGGGGTFIIDTNVSVIVGFYPIQGKYSVLIDGSTAGDNYSASIGQTGQIPPAALSLLFYLSLDSNIQLSFNGQLIPLMQTSATPNYVIMGGDISAYAGQTGELLFTGLPNGGGLIDNIQFSTQGVPEPSTLALGGLGAAALGFRRWRKQPLTR